MVTQIVAYIHFFNFTVFILAFNENIFEKVVIMLLHFLITNVSNHCNEIQLIPKFIFE